MQIVMLHEAFQVLSAPSAQKRAMIDLLSTKAVAFRLKTGKLTVEPHRGNFSIKTVFSGAERYVFSDKEIMVRPGQVLLTQQDSLYASSISTASETDSFSIFIPSSLLQENPPTFHRVQSFFASGSSEMAIPGLPSVYQRMRRIALSIESADDLSCEEELCALLIECGLAIEEVSDLSKKLPIVRDRSRVEVLRRVMLAKQILHDALGETIALSELARSVAMSDYHLMRCFKLCYGTSIGQYLSRLRMEKAGKLLMHGQYSVSEVARECGFSNLSAFGRAFRRQWGCSPSSFVNGMRKRR